MFFGGGGFGQDNRRRPREGADLRYNLTIEFTEAALVLKRLSRYLNGITVMNAKAQG